MKRLFIASLAVSAFTIGAASAADLPHKGPPLAPAPYVPNWTGFYIGGNAGGAWSRDDYSFNNGAGTLEVFNFNNTSSFIGGGQIGYQWQGPTNWVIGVEGTWSWTDLHKTDSSRILFNIGGPFHRSLKIDEIATAGVKLGYAGLWTNTLWYGKVGWAGAQVKYNSDDLIGITTSAKTWGNGMTVGGGVDYRIWNNFILSAELDYYYIPSDTVSTGSSPPGFNVSYSGTNISIFAATARLSYLFNWGP